MLDHAMPAVALLVGAWQSARLPGLAVVAFCVATFRPVALSYNA